VTHASDEPPQDFFESRRISCTGACIGAVVGLVGVTPAAGYCTCGGALLIGIFTCILSNLSGTLLKKSAAVDGRPYCYYYDPIWI
jgi:ammonium transporter, Amt family